MPDLQRFLTKSLSLILRHNAGEVQVTIDRQGFVDLSETVAAINRGSRTSGEVSETDIRAAVSADEKSRFEIDGDRIRALSGHSIEVEIAGEPFFPNGPLFFGVDARSIPRIEERGLADTAKLKVRLLPSREAAEEVAAARKVPGAVVEIDAERLAVDGWTFTRISNGEIITDKFGPGYCTVQGRDLSP